MVFLTDEHCRLSLPTRESFVQQNSSSSGSQHVTRNRKIHLTVMMLMCGRSERPFKKQMDFLFFSCISPLCANYSLSDGAWLFILKHVINSISVSTQTQQSSCCLNVRECTLSIFNLFSPKTSVRYRKRKLSWDSGLKVANQGSVWWESVEDGNWVQSSAESSSSLCLELDQWKIWGWTSSGCSNVASK